MWDLNIKESTMTRNGKAKRPLPLAASVAMYAIAIILAAATAIGNVYANKYSDLISVYFNQPTSKVVSASNETTEHFTSDYASDDEREQALADMGTTILREGVTLLKNENGTLPLEATSKISVFGQDSVDSVYGGGGAGSIDTSKAQSLMDAFEQAGFDVNPTLTEFYTTGAGKDYRKTSTDAYGKGTFAVNEVPASAYTDDVEKSFASYNDAAIVVIGRSGSESQDLPTDKLASGYTYLQLDDDERAMLKMASDNFDKVVVLLNTQNPMELADLEDDSIDAVMWIGSLGQTGAGGVAEALNGTVNPSGHLPDTYAYDLKSAPSSANFGSYAIVNGTDRFTSSYMAYAEGIYVGYRYYETRYEDVVLGNEARSNYDYTKQVAYPFGYGLSYTDFTWSDYSMKKADGGFDISVKVTNTGKTAGKDVVQLYMQSPYTDYDKANGIEKASVELVGYAKTDTLKAGASETVTVHVDQESMKTYDSAGEGTYIMDAGDYYLAAGTDAHNALNNILAAKGKTTADGMTENGNAALAAKHTVHSQDNTTYAKSAATDEKISNQFDDVDLTTYDNSFTYLSRSDWTGSWPATYADGKWTASQKFLDALTIDTAQSEPEQKPTTDTDNPSYGKLNASMLMDTDYADESWSALIGQMSVKELDQLVRIGGYATKSVSSTQLPATTDKDGPAGISSTLVGGESGMGYPSEIVIAATWNSDLAESFGKAIGEDSLALKVAVWYGPACNIHRNPYGGRAFEYFSEDSYLSGAMCAKVVAGAGSKGVVSTVKHFALNDQETNRMGGAIFANEQTIRQLYLRPFEMSVRDGGATAMMASMNRIGSRWTGGHKGLMTNTLRGEWGFNGFVVTDQASYSVFAYEDLREGLEAGTDLWLNTDAGLWKLPDDDMTDGVIANMQRAAHNISYAISRSNAMNGLSANSKIVKVTPLWRWGVYALDGVVTVGAVALIAIATLQILRRRKRDATVAAETGEPAADDGE
ncbi:glycosyl hydrolase family 3 N-terminal domain protein [Bifidobacterium dentium ATCC 27679]|uniref:Glycosyl hydrolase family 3 N-terminal domain protein n=3 Tax=Bifidobacterium dentium TaxID=1689 RepID=E0Q523_9BIFI|nr:glycosyl hydrolase family 3 N-terminal domain protein [Bifidobacterium dentium ATCC 27679]